MAAPSNTKPDWLGIFYASKRDDGDDMVTSQLTTTAEPPPRASNRDGKPMSPAAHWRRRRNAVQMPADEAARQGNIASLAFRVLGKDAAISFLNTEHSGLGGRPIALATKSKAGAAIVRAELELLAPAASDRISQNAALTADIEETEHGQRPTKIEQRNPQAESGEAQDECLAAQPKARCGKRPRNHPQLVARTPEFGI